MQKPKIKITVIGRKGPCGCHRGHKLCPMAMHVAFPYIDILRYGGSIPGAEPGTAVFCCPDVDTINVFKVEVVKDE